MSITIDEHSGFCFGVTRAIQAAESELQIGHFYQVKITQADYFDCYGEVLE